MELFGVTRQSRGEKLSARQVLAGLVYEPSISYNTFRQVHTAKHIDALRWGINLYVRQYGILAPEDDELVGTARPEYSDRLRNNYSYLREQGGFMLLWGPSGIGKSYLAQHLRHSVGTPDLSAFIRSSVDLMSMAQDLERALRSDGVEVPLNAGAWDVVSMFQRHVASFGHLRLLVLDNVQSLEQIDALFPELPNIPVLVTSQHNLSRTKVGRNTVSSDRALELGPLSEEQGLEILRLAIPGVDEQLGRQLIERLDGHPLCVDQACKYLVEHGPNLLPSLLSDLRLDAYETLSDVSAIVKIPNGLLNLYERSLRDLEAMELPSTLLRILTWLGNEDGLSTGEAQDLLTMASGRGISPTRFTATLTRLEQLGFVRFDLDGRMTIHDLTRAIVLSIWFDEITVGQPLDAIVLHEPKRDPEEAYSQGQVVDAQERHFNRTMLDDLFHPPTAFSSVVSGPFEFDIFRHVFWDYWELRLKSAGAEQPASSIVFNSQDGIVFVRHLRSSGWRPIGRFDLLEVINRAIASYQDEGSKDKKKTKIVLPSIESFWELGA
jgi:hypothetical protein